MLVAAVVGVAGAAGVVYGILLATALAPATHTTGRVTGADPVPVIDTATGVLDLDGPQVLVRATAASGGPVFLGIARADDVTAYLADVSRIEITRVGGDGGLTTVRAGAQARLPEPSGADIWVASATGTGTASLVWPDTPGLWRLVVAGDGKVDAPGQLSLVWTRAPRSSSAPAVIIVGAVLLVGGLVGGLMLRRARHGGPKGPEGRGSPESPQDEESPKSPEDEESPKNPGDGQGPEGQEDPEVRV